jgi:hypothetical protein
MRFPPGRGSYRVGTPTPDFFASVSAHFRSALAKRAPVRHARDDRRPSGGSASSTAESVAIRLGCRVSRSRRRRRNRRGATGRSNALRAAVEGNQSRRDAPADRLPDLCDSLRRKQKSRRPLLRFRARGTGTSARSHRCAGSAGAPRAVPSPAPTRSRPRRRLPPRRAAARRARRPRSRPRSRR